MDPVIVMQEIVDPQRKSGNVEEVSHRQVDQVDAELIALAYLVQRGEGKDSNLNKTNMFT